VLHVRTVHTHCSIRSARRCYEGGQEYGKFYMSKNSTEVTKDPKTHLMAEWARAAKAAAEKKAAKKKGT
jgi:hypothetical protein